MTREEAESLLDEYIDKCATTMIYERRDGHIVWAQGTDDNAISEYEQLREHIIDLICKEVCHWIPVSERLPEKIGHFLMTDDSGGMASVGESFFIPNDEGEPFWEFSNVVAWMPLPEPYKEVDVE